MKNKVLFLQNKGNSVGGIWFVNKKVSEELTKRDYDVRVLSIRNNPGKVVTEDNLNFKVYTINKNDLWEITHKSDVLKSIKQFKFFRTFYKYIVDYIKLKKDYRNAVKYINNYNPDYIVVSHYELLNIVPKKYFCKTIYHHHTSLDKPLENKSLKNTLFKYNNKINYLWLTKSTYEKAEKIGFKKNYFIYNPVRFNSVKCADVINNKKICVISRISKEKRIDLMLKLVNQAFKKYGNTDWNFELYSTDKIDKSMKKYLTDNIKFMGKPEDIEKIYLTASITLNTSSYEGFCLSILEANECGVPAISFNFGEATTERIINGKTGYIANDEDDFIDKIILLMKNTNELKKLASNCKKFNSQFNIKNIGNEWEKLFKFIDGE